MKQAEAGGVQNKYDLVKAPTPERIIGLWTRNI